MGLRSEGALLAERHERGEELPLGLRPLRRPLHHLLEELGERPPEELGPVAQRERDVGDVAVALLRARGSAPPPRRRAAARASSDRLQRCAAPRRSPSASAAASTASRTTSASSPSTSRSTMRYACGAPSRAAVRAPADLRRGRSRGGRRPAARPPTRAPPRRRAPTRRRTDQAARRRRRTNGRMPPCRKYSRSRGVSRRTRARNSLPSARTVTSRASPFSTPAIENSSRPVRPSDARRLAVQELERQDAHHQEVRAVDPLVRLRDHRAHAEQVRPLRRPVARRARAVLLAGEHDRRHAFGAVAARDVEDRAFLAVGEMHRPRSLAALDELVAEADVRERAAHHHLVVAAPRAVRVELAPLDAVLDQVLPGRRVGADRAGRRDVVGRDRVAEHHEHARAGDVLDRRAARAACRRSTAAGARTSSRDPTRRGRPPACRARASARRR